MKEEHSKGIMTTLVQLEKVDQGVLYISLISSDQLTTEAAKDPFNHRRR